MNWIRENKFLVGFIAVLVIGVGVLGYLLYSAYGSYADITDQYTQQANELHRLQSLAPYPDKDNLAKYVAEYDGLVDATHNLATGLAKMVLPIEQLSPSAFQEHLRDTVSNVVTKAEKTGVKLPDKFAMDFDRYQTEPPAQAAASPLGRQLAAIEIAMNILLDEHVESVSSLRRSPLPEEGGGTHSEHGGGRPGARSENLVEKFPFDIQFTANQPAFRRVLNDFAASSKQFFIVRSLVVENTDPKPVAKSANTSAPAPGASPPPGGVAAATGAPGAPGEVSHLKFLVGTEKLNVVMRVEMIAFNPPETSARKGGGPSAH